MEHAPSQGHGTDMETVAFGPSTVCIPTGDLSPGKGKAPHTGVCEMNTLLDSGLFLHAATPLP